MSFEHILQFATLSTVVIGVIGIMVRINGNRRQLNANLFIEYANLYDNVIMSFPIGDPPEEISATDVQAGRHPEVRVTVTRFLHFLAGAYYFHRKGYLENDAWQIWEGQINRILRSPIFVSEWRRYSRNNQISTEFRRYIEAVQNEEQQNHAKNSLS